LEEVLRELDNYKNIHLIERNYQNALIIYGAIGKKVYCLYSKKDAIKKYNKQCKENKNGKN
jgi:hypothetical protein